MANAGFLADLPIIINMPGRPVNSGVVFVKNGSKSAKKRYLKACCGGTEEQPAKLELFEDVKAANKGKTRLVEIIFTKVKRIVNTTDDNRRLIVIEMHESDGLCFYSDNETEHKKWVRYCGLLSTIPNYSIPEEPKYNLVPQEFIDKYTDPGRFDAVSAWIVYIINEDVGKKLGYEGLHIIAIKRNSTMNIHNFHSGKHLLSWDRDKLRRSGCIGSLVFMEAGRRCYGGPGLLWMCCPVSVAGKFRECLHNFLFYGPEDGSKSIVTAPSRSTSMSSSGPLTFDSGLNSVSPSNSVSDSHPSSSHLSSSSSQTQSKCNGDSGVNMSPPPVNLKTHPSLRRRSNEGYGGTARTIQRSVSQDASSHTEDDLQFNYNRGTPSPESGPNEQLDERFRNRTQQISNSKEQYEFMRHPTKVRAESAPPIPGSASNYIQMKPSDKGRSMSESKVTLANGDYVNHVIPIDAKAPSENYENTGFNAMRVPPIPPKGTTENLATIREAESSSYENHTPSCSDYVNNSIKPVPGGQYENVSQNSLPPLASVNNYQNISLDPSASPRMNTHETVVLKKSEQKNSVKDHSGSLQYSEVDSGKLPKSSPPKLQRQYSDIDCNATKAVEAQQRQRTLQKEHSLQTKVH